MVRELKTALLEAEKKFKEAEDRRIRESFIAKQQAEALTLRLDAAKQNLSGDLQAATVKASKYKKPFHKADKKLDTARIALGNMSKTYEDRPRAQERVEVELLQLRSDLADWDAQVDRLLCQESGWEQKCLLAARDRDVIGTHLAQLASGSLRLPLNITSTASATTQTGERSRSTDPNPPIKLPRAAKMTQSGTESVDNPSTKSADGSLQSTGPV